MSPRGLNVSPLIDGDRVYMTQAEENVGTTSMGTIIGIDGSKKGDVTKTGELWRQDGMVGKSSPVLVDGRLYAFDDGGKIYVVDVKTGKLVGKPLKMVGTILRSSPVYGDGKIYACTTSAWHIIEPTKSGAKFTQKLRLTPEDEVSGSPIISHGRVYLPTGARIYCLGKPGVKPAIGKAPKSRRKRRLAPTLRLPKCKSCPPKCCSSRARSRTFKSGCSTRAGSF